MYIYYVAAGGYVEGKTKMYVRTDTKEPHFLRCKRARRIEKQDTRRILLCARYVRLRYFVVTAKPHVV